jgi:2-polyprenyl-3-methyl-5-hydroxy-6-metoxy-1,4-benzoquinol methylase
MPSGSNLQQFIYLHFLLLAYLLATCSTHAQEDSTKLATDTVNAKWNSAKEHVVKDVWIKMTPEKLKNQWDKEYKIGGWDCLSSQPAERARSAIIAGTYYQQYASNGSFLDVGCGEGVMFDYLSSDVQRSKYLGVDISVEGINIGRKKRPNAEFVVSRAEDFNVDGRRRFDFIVFSEMIYYSDHKKTLERYGM